MTSSSNFELLAEYDPVFLQLAMAPKQALLYDPSTILIKLRQLSEALAQDIATRAGVFYDDNTTQANLLWKLNRENRLDSTTRNLFHIHRFEGNMATHHFKTQQKREMGGLRIERARRA